MAVDHLETRLRGCAGTHQNLKGIRDISRTETTDIVRINRIRKAELLPYRHLCGSLSRNLLGTANDE